MWSPALATFRTAIMLAIWPEVVRSAPTPPSILAIFCSTYAQVGLEMREYMWPSTVRSNRPATSSVVL